MNKNVRIIIALILLAGAVTVASSALVTKSNEKDKKKEEVAAAIHAEMLKKYDTTRSVKLQIDTIMFCADNLAYISDACVKRLLSSNGPAGFSEQYNKRLYEIQSESVKLVRKYGYQPEDFQDVVIKAKSFNLEPIEK